MILLIQDSQFDEVAPTPAAKVAYARAVEEACREVVVGFRTAADGDQVEQRAGCVGALVRHPAVYTGAFLRQIHELGAEAASDAQSAPVQVPEASPFGYKQPGSVEVPAMTQAQFDEWLDEYRRKKAEGFERAMKTWPGLRKPKAGDVPMWNEAEPMKVSAWEGT